MVSCGHYVEIRDAAQGSGGANRVISTRLDLRKGGATFRRSTDLPRFSMLVPVALTAARKRARSDGPKQVQSHLQVQAFELWVHVCRSTGGTHTPVQCWASVEGSPQVVHFPFTQVCPFVAAIVDPQEARPVQPQCA